MAFDELQSKRYEKMLKGFIERRRPPVEVREEVDLGFNISKNSVEIFEIRRLWDNQDKKIECPVAKATYIQKSNIWKIYWRRADLKWHRYDPDPEVDTLDEFLAVVDEDEYCCFWG